MAGQQLPVYTDASATATGTPLASVTLDGLVLAQSCLLSGGLPQTNGTLSLVQPQTQAVVNTGTQAAQLTLAAATLVFAASSDTYVDLSVSGTYTLAAVATNAAAPSVTANSARLYKAVSGVGAVTAILPLLPTSAVPTSGPTPLPARSVGAPDEGSANYNAYGTGTQQPTDTLQHTIWRILYKAAAGLFTLLQSGISYDSTEGATSSGTSSLLDNLNHIREALTTLAGGTWAQALANRKTAILNDGTNAGPVLTMTSSTLDIKAATVNTGTYGDWTNWQAYQYPLALLWQALWTSPPGAGYGGYVGYQYIQYAASGGTAVPNPGALSEPSRTITRWLTGSYSYGGSGFTSWPYYTNTGAPQYVEANVTITGARPGDTILWSYRPTSISGGTMPYGTVVQCGCKANDTVWVNITRSLNQSRNTADGGGVVYIDVIGHS